jgi:succinate-semialdehyde dehydrogenase/glutarate-semialdehyde dehydrogenase
VYGEFMRRFKEAVSTFVLGHGDNDRTTHGPLISPAAVARVHGLVEDSVRRGAKIEFGGRKRPDLGKSALVVLPECKRLINILVGPNFYEPTVLSDVTGDMRVCKEEIFGPVAPVSVFHDEAAALSMANDCDVGLAAYIFTQDANRATRVTEQLQCGMVALNTGIISDAALP